MRACSSCLHLDKKTGFFCFPLSSPLVESVMLLHSRSMAPILFLSPLPLLALCIVSSQASFCRHETFVGTALERASRAQSRSSLLCCLSAGTLTIVIPKQFSHEYRNHSMRRERERERKYTGSLSGVRQSRGWRRLLRVVRATSHRVCDDHIGCHLWTASQSDSAAEITACRMIVIHGFLK